MKTHRDLDVWTKSMDFAEQVYKITEKFPDKEKYSLTNQLRRAAISVPSNIAEGATRNSHKEFIQFLYIALGSTSELETQLLLSRRIGYVKDIDQALNDLTVVRKLISGLLSSIKRKNM